MTPQLPLAVHHFAAQTSVESGDRFQLEHLSNQNMNTFWELWETYRHELLSQYGLRWMGGNLEDAEDALSSAGLKALEFLSTHDIEINNVKHWLKRILYNHCMTVWRQQKKCVDFDLSMDRGNATRDIERVSTSSCSSPEHVVLSDELKRALQGAIDNLPRPLREPARLRFLSEMCYHDIALKLNLYPANVRKRIQHARHLIQTYLQDYDLDALQPPITPSPYDDTTPVAAPAEPEISVHYVALRLLCIRTTDGIEHYLPVALDALPCRQRQKLDTLRAYVKQHPSGWKKHLSLANLLYQSGDWEAAISMYRHVLNIQPRDLNAWCRLGAMLQSLHRHQEALAVYQQALGSAQQIATQHHLHGLSFVCRHQLDEAAKAFECARDLEPDNIAHHYALGFTQLRANRPRQALRAYDAVLASHPDDPVAFTYSYDALRALDQWPEAQKRVTRALEIDPKNVLAIMRLVEYRIHKDLLDGKDGRDTATLLRRALRLAPHAPELKALIERIHSSKNV